MAFRAVIAAATTVLAAAALLVVPGGAASAVVNPTGSYVYEDQTFFAYVGAGETLDVSLTRFSGATGPVSITATSPAGDVPLSCAHSTGTANGTVCAATGLSSPTAGVWTIAIDVSAAPRYAYNIQVRDASAAAITGRIWTTRVSQYQSSTTTQSYWIATREGYVYGIQFRNYNGLGSAIEANGFGLVEAGTCTPIYRSAEGTAIGANGVFLEAGVDYSETCGDDYLIFFEAPAADLPASATSATGAVWIRPAVVPPSVENLALVAAAPATRAGSIAFDLAGVNGGYSVQIDANADGDYSDPVDRLIPYGSPPGAVSVPFDGLDGLGDPIGVCQPLNARVVVDRVGETHFVLQDVEQLGDGAGNAAGVRVSGVAGVPGPNPRLYWNDTTLRTDRPGYLNTAPFGGPDGTAGTDTSTIPNGNGTHGWRNDWGDIRSIENWTYYATDAGAEVAVPPPCNPGMTIDKDGALADANSNGRGDVGETIQYTFLVSNTGNAPLVGVAVNDPRVTGITPATADIAVGGSRLFTAAPYTVTQADVDSGSILNTATASGETPEGGDVDTPPDSDLVVGPDRVPGLAIDKSSVLNDELVDNDVADLDETIDYSFTVTNTGNVTLSGVTVDDPRVTGITPAPVTLAPGASQVFTASPYAVTQADLRTGSIVNTATATGTSPLGPVGSPPDSETTPTSPPDPLLELDKSGALGVDADADGAVSVGDTVRYTFTVTNTGNVDLTAVSVDDPRVAGAIAPAQADIAAGGVQTYTADYVVTQADVDAGVLRNTALARGSYTPPGGPAVSVDSAVDSVELPTDRRPALALEKSGSLADANANGFADVGETVSYSFTATNTGNTTLTDIEILDPRVTGLVASTQPLSPGGSVTITAAPYTVTQADVDAGGVANVASARGRVPGGPETTSPPDDFFVAGPPPAPGLTIDKTATLDDTDGDGLADAGERIVYSFTLVNTGNVTLADVRVVDPRIAQLLPAAVGRLAPGVMIAVDALPYLVTAADIAAGPIVNVASATGTTPNGDAYGSEDDSVTVRVQPPAVGGSAPGGSLAATGQDVAGIIGVAVLALLLGVALLLVRRRRRR